MFALGKYAGVLLLQLLISFNNFNGIFSGLDMYEGDACQWKEKSGICALLKDCPSLNNDLMTGKVTPYNIEKCAFKGNDIVACCTDLSSSIGSIPTAEPQKTVPDFLFPLNGTSTTPKTAFTENADNEQGNSIDTELTTINTNWRPGDNRWAAFEFRTSTVRTSRDTDGQNNLSGSNDINSVINSIFNRPAETTTASSTLSAITDYPLKNFGYTTKKSPVDFSLSETAVEEPQQISTTTTAQPLILDSWMLEALEESRRPTTTTTTTTKKPRSDIGYIDLSKRTTTTPSPPVISNEFNNTNNVQTVWVVKDPSPPSQHNSQQSQPNWSGPIQQQPQNWNGPIQQQPQNWNGQIQQRPQNWNGPIQQQSQQPPNWNRPQQQASSHWNNPTEQVQVVVIEEEPNWNSGRGSRFRQGKQNWNRPPVDSNFQVDTNFNNNNNNGPVETQHHTWNGNNFNQGRPIGNSNVEFVKFPNSNQGTFGNSNINTAQVGSTIITSSINPDNPFLKSVINSAASSSQKSAQLIQLGPVRTNNNNNPVWGFQSGTRPQIPNKSKEDNSKENPTNTDIRNQQPGNKSNDNGGKRPAEIACDEIKRQFSTKSIDNKIIEGMNAEPGEFPHMVALGYGNDEIEWSCAGTLISDRYVLTAGHCVKNRQTIPVLARMGRNNIREIDSNDENPFDSRIGNISLHKQYRQTQSYNDIALIRLTEPVKLKTGLHPACLYTKNTDLNENMNLTITGWGTTDVKTRKTSDVLQKAIVKLVSLKECSEIPLLKGDKQLPRGIINSQLCAKDNKADTCQGDSGGPIQITDDTPISTIVGITSFGISCASSTPGVYTRVSSYIEWIESVVWPELI